MTSIFISDVTYDVLIKFEIQIFCQQRKEYNGHIWININNNGHIKISVIFISSADKNLSV